MTARRRGNAENGFTVVELTIASVVLAIVVASMVGLLDSQTRADKRIQALVNSQEDVRLALTAVSRDIRAADPMIAQATLDDYRDQIDMTLYDPSGASRHVRWKLDPSAQVLTRATIATDGTSSTTYRVPRVRNDASTTAQPLFSYYDGANNNLLGLNSAPGQSSTLPGDMVRCTSRVHVRIVADTNPGPQPFTDEADVELRNQAASSSGQQQGQFSGSYTDVCT